ncbi:MAG: hypothetical protein ACYDCB_01925 [Candidatus Dormibacteria bacterium]
MILDSLLAAAGFVAAAIALLAVGPTGMWISALALGLGLGGVAALAGGINSFLALAGVGAVAAVLVAAGRWAPLIASGRWLLGNSPVVGRERVFDVRSLRLLLGLGGLLAARLLSGHLAPGTVSTQGPAFACLFAFEVGIIRVATGRGPSDLALGSLCVGMGSGAFMLLGSSGTAVATALLMAGGPALALVLLARAVPWETGS